jgi:hypothetical protein
MATSCWFETGQGHQPSPRSGFGWQANRSAFFSLAARLAWFDRFTLMQTVRPSGRGGERGLI